MQGCISTHGLAEFYAVLTRAPFTPRVHPAEAGRFLDVNILPYFELIALSADDYKAVHRACTNAGVVGGAPSQRTERRTAIASTVQRERSSISGPGRPC